MGHDLNAITYGASAGDNFMQMLDVLSEQLRLTNRGGYTFDMQYNLSYHRFVLSVMCAYYWNLLNPMFGD